jgi:hypothetical protein
MLGGSLKGILIYDNVIRMIFPSSSLYAFPKNAFGLGIMSIVEGGLKISTLCEVFAVTLLGSFTWIQLATGWITITTWTLDISNSKKS